MTLFFTLCRQHGTFCYCHCPALHNSTVDRLWPSKSLPCKVLSHMEGVAAVFGASCFFMEACLYCAVEQSHCVGITPPITVQIAPSPVLLIGCCHQRGCPAAEGIFPVLLPAQHTAGSRCQHAPHACVPPETNIAQALHTSQHTCTLSCTCKARCNSCC